MKKHIAALLFITGVVFCFTGCGTLGSEERDEAMENARHYQCQSGESASVVSVAEDVITVTYGEQAFELNRAISASGARYSDSTQEWWEKGDEATIRDVKTGGIIDTCTLTEEK
ncbi:MliC family protein [Desulfosarcina sp. OttesenSCG-928-A07]|nr:MliC family protein [Desulfosarcina sp. OttesenSCG-928-G17]MDL2328162.1 MliC family protein [Desulfosarcina sp. OttesenSCG-928-A07]